MRLLVFPPASQPARRPGSASRGLRERGQIIVIFAGAMLALVALCAVVIDVAWYWTGNLRMQRAADAAALAGVVYLPGDVTKAYDMARKEAIKNGFTDGVGGIVITPQQSPTNNRRLRVTITGPVGTFFARVVGINSFPAKRDALADYVLPVPMGSPDNYYGVGYFVEPQPNDTPGDSGWQNPQDAPSGGQWSYTPTFFRTITTAVRSNDNEYAIEDTNGQQQQWRDFGLQSGGAIPNPGGNQTLTILGLEVRLTDAFVSTTCANSTIGVDLSWNGGATWSTRVSAPTAGGLRAAATSTTDDYTLGLPTSTAAWGGHTWVRNDFSDANFRMRLTANKGCPTVGTTLNVDELEVRVSWNLRGTTLVQDAPVPPPPGQSAITRPQKFWGAMQSQGAPSIQGDAFMTKYDTRTSIPNAVSGTDPDAHYDYRNYYNYSVEIPAGGGGSVWVFDPGFCDGSPSAGTGEYWTVGGANGNNTRQPVSAYFDLLDTKGTALDLADDTLVGSTNTTYQRLSGEDHDIFDAQGTTPTAGIADCSSAPGHFGWVLLRSGLAKGTYRLHTYSTQTNEFNPSIPNNLNDQNNTTALNAFAFYASSASGSPRVYGLGAMEAYVRLPAGQVSEFYLAQIDAVHAGKTMVINLWDPGDTGSLSANLAILKPTGSGFTPAAFDYQGTPGNTSATAGCGNRSGTGVFSVTTNTGGSSLYNGCWLTIEVVLPTDYSAPVDPATGEAGWWKIRYTMGNQSGSGATDLTTWKVDIRGNPVHLVTP